MKAVTDAVKLTYNYFLKKSIVLISFCKTVTKNILCVVFSLYFRPLHFYNAAWNSCMYVFGMIPYTRSKIIDMINNRSHEAQTHCFIIWLRCSLLTMTFLTIKALLLSCYVTLLKNGLNGTKDSCSKWSQLLTSVIKETKQKVLKSSIRCTLLQLWTSFQKFNLKSIND